MHFRKDLKHQLYSLSNYSFFYTHGFNLIGSLLVAKKKFNFFHKRNMYYKDIMQLFSADANLIWFFYFFFCPQKVETWPIIHKPHLFKNPNLSKNTIILRHIFILISSNLYTLFASDLFGFLRILTYFLRKNFSDFFESLHTFCVVYFLISSNLYILFASYIFRFLRIFREAHRLTWYFGHFLGYFLWSIQRFLPAAAWETLVSPNQNLLENWDG